MTLSTKQIEMLAQGLNPKRVLKANGQSHLPAYDVIAMLDCIFGFDGWSKEIAHLGLVFETANEQNKWTVCYSCTMRLTVAGKFSDDASTGEAINQPSRADAHDLAMKSAISLALKRCAKDLGNQFGLSLYNKGQVAPLYTLPVDMGDHDPTTADVAPPQSMGNDEIDRETGEIQPAVEHQGPAPADQEPLPTEPPPEDDECPHGLTSGTCSTCLHGVQPRAETELKVSECRSCNAGIIWVITEKGKRMPIDVDPSADGTFLLTHQFTAEGNPEVRYVHPGSSTSTALHASHFSTCPDAEAHRK